LKPHLTDVGNTGFEPDIEVYKGNIIQGFKGWISGAVGSQELWFNTQQVFNQRRYKKKKELVV
tara:strand:- start:1324 stop:1512 length:189 start_codon:yes stop_codon:yes gene_type:complete